MQNHLVNANVFLLHYNHKVIQLQIANAGIHCVCMCAVCVHACVREYVRACVRGCV